MRAFHPKLKSEFPPARAAPAESGGGIILRPRGVVSLSVIIIIWYEARAYRDGKSRRGVSACVIRKVAKCSVTFLYARTKAAE
jgi:hypothetical protein